MNVLFSLRPCQDTTPIAHRIPDPMKTITLIQSMLPSAVIVLSFFFAVRCLFVHEMRLEAWRSPVKHIIYVGQVAFRRIILATGCLCFLIFLTTTYLQFMKLIGA